MNDIGGSVVTRWLDKHVHHYKSQHCQSGTEVDNEIGKCPSPIQLENKRNNQHFQGKEQRLYGTLKWMQIIALTSIDPLVNSFRPWIINMTIIISVSRVNPTHDFSRDTKGLSGVIKADRTKV